MGGERFARPLIVASFLLFLSFTVGNSSFERLSSSSYLVAAVLDLHPVVLEYLFIFMFSHSSFTIPCFID